ncbi:sigma 54-interacting transcriptional regulator [Bythopirellula polymerisocia]|uniref:Regulatory protein LuxO n=1 Tax=Bythopirellula polymerisocia TaxID=2528003 RepID=A0A5C6CHF2_9BACT|nr:sigma 54-interacting transcriptional regulator [Bythopirellula polymerisocia]TWU22701.1 Regulatory protein LuxO [Bythopirellula polymerisocia]
MYAYLTIQTGKQAGTNYTLDPSTKMLLGRGSDCHISVPDPMCSRVHAIISFEDDSWIVRDDGSRNGTLVNGQKVEEATLGDGHQLQIGSYAFEFHLSDQPATADTNDLSQTQTIVQDKPIAVQQTNQEVLAALPTPEQVQELVLLYQLSIHLLGCEEPDEVIRVALELLRERTKAAVVGFLWVDDEDQLKPKIVIPKEGAECVRLSQSLTELVMRQGHAVWVANQSAGDSPKSSVTFADAVCAPLVRKQANGDRLTLGAIHVYLRNGRFRQSDFDFVIAVANLVAISLVRARSQASMRSDFRHLVSASPGYDELVGESRVMQELQTKIQRVGAAPGCVLIRGESGSGKELVARAIHQASHRADRPMMSVNCAAIPEELMESQLFGHQAGAFTGADRDHIGFFQQCDLGTLFLDEIGEMPLEGQAKLLRILEGHPFLPVGSTQEVQVDVRVIAATNQDLKSYVREKKFREDLYYRLSVFELHLPPLRDRNGDIGLLIDFFLEHYRKQRGRPHLELSEDARSRLLDYRWPGNVRQLRNVIDSAVVLAEDDGIRPRDLGLHDVGDQELDTLEIDRWERKLIIEALKRSDGNVPEAAKLLNIGRATLYRKIELYNISR